MKVISIVFCLFLIGCAGINGPTATKIIATNDIVAYIYDDDLQSTYFKAENGETRFCMEPNPDSTATRSEGLNVGYTGSAIGENASDGAVTLGGRNPATLIVRTLMFRACELSLNLNANYEQSRDIYREFLKAAMEISKSQTGIGSSGGVSDNSKSHSMQQIPINKSPTSQNPPDPPFCTDPDPANCN